MNLPFKLGVLAVKEVVILVIILVVIVLVDMVAVLVGVGEGMSGKGVPGVNGLEHLRGVCVCDCVCVWRGLIGQRCLAHGVVHVGGGLQLLLRHLCAVQVVAARVDM